MSVLKTRGISKKHQLEAGNYWRKQLSMGLETEPPCKKIKMPLDSVILRFAKLTKNALSPTRGSKLAAGYDLYR